MKDLPSIVSDSDSKCTDDEGWRKDEIAGLKSENRVKEFVSVLPTKFREYAALNNIKTNKFYEKVKDINLIITSSRKANNIKSDSFEDFCRFLSNFGELLDVDEGNKIFSVRRRNVLITGSFDKHTKTKDIQIHFHGEKVDEIEEAMKFVKNELDKIREKEIPRIIVDWDFSTVDGRIRNMVLSEEINDIFHSEAYPYINIKKLSDTYLDSEEPILILIGPPGTGKTRLIRYITKQMILKIGNDIRCKFTSDKKIVESSESFLEFIGNSDFKLMVMEDIDYHLQPRSNGNSSMYNLLSVSNGIILNHLKNKKIILSTNLDTTTKIDSALLRPGRCFQVLELRRLTQDESKTFLKKFDVSVELKQPNYSLAELYRILNGGELRDNSSHVENKVGFCR